MATVYIAGQRLTLNPSLAIGKGGEADVYDIGNGLVFKLFKEPGHLDYANNPQEQEGAKKRIATHQRKLPAFPRSLPSSVVTPIDLGTNQTGKKILGYTMSYLKNTEVLFRYGERSFREAGVNNEAVMEIFRDLHPTVTGIHKAGVVAGDFNDLNILIKGTKAFVIDADSFQFGSFYCPMFSTQFVDPLLCDPKLKRPALIRPHTADSDWYAYSVMLMKCLLYVDPYGGVYRPKRGQTKVLHGQRPLHRITIFRPEVIYPKPATHYQVLPDDLLQFFHQTFEKDQRGEFPLKLIEQVRWTKCTKCDTEHARGICPNCSHHVPQAVKMTVRGKVTVTKVFRTDSGHIVFAAMQNGKLHYLYRENEKFMREGSKTVSSESLDPQMRFRIHGDKTMIAKGNRLLTVLLDGSRLLTNVDTFGNLPIFDANASHQYWTSAGQLWRNGQFGREVIGDVLAGQTLFWVGPEFGFGFYRAGELSVAFVFDAKKHGINDQVKLPRVVGQIVDTTCIFTANYCWFLVATREAGQTIHRAYLINRKGTVEATAEAGAGDGSWLGTLRGKTAVGNLLFAPTDDGIVRAEAEAGTIVETRNFPDTEPFVDSSSHLYASSDGIYVVGRKEVTLLTIKP